MWNPACFRKPLSSPFEGQCLYPFTTVHLTPGLRDSPRPSQGPTLGGRRWLTASPSYPLKACHCWLRQPHSLNSLQRVGHTDARQKLTAGKEVWTALEEKKNPSPNLAQSDWGSCFTSQQNFLWMFSSSFHPQELLTKTPSYSPPPPSSLLIYK